MLQRLITQIRRAKRVYLCGNGGSAANAIHFANDLFACGVRAHALCADVSTLTAIANDFGYEEIFSRQVQTFSEPRDLLICLSGSGKSPNILKALWTAKTNCAVHTTCLFGAYNDHAENAHNIDLLLANGQTMQEAEEMQLYIAHGVMTGLKEGHIEPDSLTMVHVNKYFEENHLPARCAAVEGRKIVMSIDEQTNATTEHLLLWLERITGAAWAIQVQPWKWPA